MILKQKAFFALQNTFLKKWIIRTAHHFQQWQQPEGYDTGIKIHNTALRQKVPLILRHKGVATWYTCGPTVYADAHIGHASCYVKLDIIQKVLKNIFNINVVTLMGVTDIDDKIIDKAQKMGVSPDYVAKKYELDFFRDMESLNVQLPTLTAHVTDYIPKIISFCQTLIDKNFAYVTSEGNVYFDVTKIEVEPAEQNYGTYRPVIDPLKKDPRDFALWKASKPSESYWLSPWGKGRPGWHIECSAMASHVFGSQIDIHSGGFDLVFPHHANEKSQSEAYHGCKQWVNYWLHTGLLHVQDDVKMSKSLENTISIKDFLKENSANDFRILCLRSEYCHNIEYTEELLNEAKSVCERLYNFLNDAECFINGELICQGIDTDAMFLKLSAAKDSIYAFLADDFNTDYVLTVLLNLINEISGYMKPSAEFIVDSAIVGNVNVIAAYADFVDKTLESLGVHIICKKKLPKLVVYIVDSVVHFRSKIRMYALHKNLDVSENAAPMISDEEQCEENGKQLNFVHNAFLKLKTSFFNCDISLDIDSDWSTELFEKQHHYLISKCSYEYFKDIVCLTESLVMFCHKVFELENNILNEQAMKNQKEKEILLLKACDEFRDYLKYAGIGIKDRKAGSSWLPLAKREKVMR